MADVFGGYRLIRSIAVGGVGEVFHAENEMGPCALKRLHRALARDDVARALFEEEGRLARRFEHPHLVRGLDAGGVGDDELYIALELVRGPNLAQAVATRRPTLERAIRVAVDLCAGLARVHTEGWVHCDVSPTNILINPDGRAQLTDFGVATLAGVRQSQVRGTFGYMAPEQAQGGTLDARTDVFAVGIVLWEMITARRLFHRAERYLTLTAVVDDPAPPVDGPPNLQATLARALAKVPDERFGSCDELAHALSGC
jgi:serine/threonine protein kinase